MTITWSIYFLGSVYVLWSAIQAYQPDGYLGCFEDVAGDSLVNFTLIYENESNKGEVCKAECKYNTKRYAGTKHLRCYCGSGVVQNRKRSSTQCNKTCPGNSGETCGGYYREKWNRISLYDTWLCITGPCQNGASCTDIDADNFMCSCSVGWTGRVCNETVATATYTLSQSPSTQAIRSLTEAQTVTFTTYKEHRSPSTQAIGSSTEADQPEGNKLVIYIAVPLSIFVIIVFVLIATVLILRKKLNQKKTDGLQATYQISPSAAAVDNGHNFDAIDQTAGDSYHNYDAIDRTGDNDHNYHAVDRNGDSDHNYYVVDRTGDSDHNYEGVHRTADSDHSYYSIDQSVCGDRNYSNIDRNGKGSAFQNDGSGYGNLSLTA